MTDPRIRIAQYGRSWFSAYTVGGRGHFIAMGKTRREAEELAVQKLPPLPVPRNDGGAGNVPAMSPQATRARSNP